METPIKNVSYREDFFEARDGTRLYRRCWGQPKQGVVALVHGFGEHVGRYVFLVQHLTEQGFRVEAFDCRGHGRSCGKRGHVQKFQDYIEDLDVFLHKMISEQPHDLPLFLLGHSQGGHIVLRYGLDFPQTPLTGVITSSPFLGMALRVSPIQRAAARVMNQVWPAFSQSTPIAIHELTHHVEVIERTRRDPLYSNMASARWFEETIQAQKETMQQAHSFQFPLLMQLAGDDRLVDKHTASLFFDHIQSQDRQRLEYAGYFHEIYNETPDRRHLVFQDLSKWLKDRS